MQFPSNTVLAFFLTIILNSICGYVLIAANLDDIRGIAKKFVSENLAEELVRAASATFLKLEHDSTQAYAPRANRKQRAYTIEPAIIPTNSPIQDELLSKINLDAIVEKVKERLVNEYRDIKDIYKKTTRNEHGIYIVKSHKPTAKTTPYSYPSIYSIAMPYYAPQYATPGYDYNSNVNYYKPQRQGNRFQNPETTKNVDIKEIYDGTQEQEPPAYGEVGTVKTDLKWNTSYEDYKPKNEVLYESEDVTTKRYRYNKNKFATAQSTDNKQFESMRNKNKITTDAEDMIYPSKEVGIVQKRPTGDTRFVKVQNREDNNERPIKNRVAKSTARTTTVTSSDDYEDAEIKARTENIGYDEKVLMEEIKKKGAKPMKNTKIPKRDFYKLSSPDYYKKLPNVAEKYDFNEPLPEKDREHENYKPFVNPPARVNKKIRLT